MAKESRPKKKNIIPILTGEADAFLPATRLEVTSNKEALVEGCRGVLEYGPEQIKLAGEKLMLRFQGTDLEIKNLTTQSALVVGNIISVEFLL